MYSRILSHRQMTVWCITLSGALALCIGLQGLLGWGRTQLDTGAALAADTLRLHIRAASDTTADQTDKLAVRDAVLAYLDTACPAADQPAALRWAAAHLSELQRVARTVLAGRGSFAPVRVYLVEMYFGTTRYSASALPAGRYQALRIDIGAAPMAGTGGVCSTPASAAPPAAAMPPRRERPRLRAVSPAVQMRGVVAEAHRPPGRCHPAGITWPSGIACRIRQRFPRTLPPSAA